MIAGELSRGKCAKPAMRGRLRREGAGAAMRIRLRRRKR